jgi:hypothetical protein
MKKKLIAVALASAIAGGIVGVAAPAIGSSSQPIQAIRCQSFGGFRYTRYVYSTTWRAECPWPDKLVGIQFGF